MGMTQFGTMLFLPTVEKGGALWSKDGNSGFGEDNFAVVVAELADSKQVVLEGGHDLDVLDWE